MYKQPQIHMVRGKGWYTDRDTQTDSSGELGWPRPRWHDLSSTRAAPARPSAPAHWLFAAALGCRKNACFQADVQPQPTHFQWAQ